MLPRAAEQLQLTGNLLHWQLENRKSHNGKLKLPTSPLLSTSNASVSDSRHSGVNTPSTASADMPSCSCKYVSTAFKNDSNFTQSAGPPYVNHISFKCSFVSSLAPNTES